MISKLWKNFNHNLTRKSSINSNIDDLIDIDQIFQEHHISPINAYLENVVVYKCIELITMTASHVPWLVLNESNYKKTLSNHYFNKILSRPNSNQNGIDFISELISNFLIYGNAYVLIESRNNDLSNDKAKNIITGMRNIHPNSINISITSRGIKCYTCTIGEQERKYTVDPITGFSKILHISNYNPYIGNQQGISPIQAASEAITLYNKTLQWNNALLNNIAKPSGVLSFEQNAASDNLTETQFERLKKQFYKYFSGANNSGKPLILEGGLSWQETCSAERLEKFLELKDSSARDIAMAFNIPPQLLGIAGDNTYSNMQEARFALWEENIIPLLHKLTLSFSNLLSIWSPHEKLIIDFDRESISSIIEKRQDLWEKVSQANFMTINEKRSLFNLPPVSNGDKIHF